MKKVIFAIIFLCVVGNELLENATANIKSHHEAIASVEF